jgi:hypothetical protein
MRGGAQSHLMLGADDQLYVVKFQNNPQDRRVLANEYLATHIAAEVGLTTPKAKVVAVTSELIDNSPNLEIDLGRRRQKCHPGLQFGAQFAGGLMPGMVVDSLPTEELRKVKNLNEFAGMLAFDKWTGNGDGRQAVFVRGSRERRYRAFFIDHGYCFNAGSWKFEDIPLRGVYFRNEAYEGVCGWESFEPWLTRLESFAAETIWKIACAMPAQWYGGNQSELEELVGKLVARRGRIRDLIAAFARTDKRPFPRWPKRVTRNAHPIEMALAC